MKINNLYILRLFAVILSILLLKSVCAQDSMDSVFQIPTSPFLKDLIGREGRVNVIAGGSLEYSSIKNELLKSFGYELIKTRDKELYVHIWRTGRLYKLDRTLPLDSALVFRRIDNTWNYNYNIGSFVFTVDNDIYEIGGYGFWKSNGVLRKYNSKDREWDVIVANKEVFIPHNSTSGHICWVDTAESSLYVPYERVTNDGLAGYSDGGINVPRAFRLDIAKSQWEELGELKPDILELFKSTSVTIAVPTGILLCYTSKVFWLNYLTNQISVYENPVIAQTLSRVNKSFLYYNFKDWVYWYQPGSSRYDSLQIDYSKFQPYGKPIWQKNWTWVQLTAFGLLLIAMVIGLVWWKLGRKKQPPVFAPHPIDTAGNPFTATEVSLIQLLVKKTRSAQTTSIDEINYVLGTKEKNPGMQKKVRSDIINSINDKFRLLNGSPGVLVQSIRSESDKRYFEYKINKELLAGIEGLLG